MDLGSSSCLCCSKSNVMNGRSLQPGPWPSQRAGACLAIRFSQSKHLFPTSVDLKINLDTDIFFNISVLHPQLFSFLISIWWALGDQASLVKSDVLHDKLPWWLSG